MKIIISEKLMPDIQLQIIICMSSNYNRKKKPFNNTLYKWNNSKDKLNYCHIKTMNCQYKINN